MNALAHAVLAVAAAAQGDTATAQVQLASAQRQARTAARRERQLVEIAALVVAGDRTRAAGLALEHGAAFPDDADLLARLAHLGARPPDRSAVRGPGAGRP